jgi:hypothetical protein
MSPSKIGVIVKVKGHCGMSVPKSETLFPRKTSAKSLYVFIQLHNYC